MSYREVIFIGLPGPYHNYGGLSQDNLASTKNRHRASNPQEAVLQALELVSMLRALGITVGILPPLLRPHLPSLPVDGGHSAAQKISYAANHHPALLEQCYSSSAMWTANAATIAPSPDTEDGKLHLTSANLFTKPHRRIEAEDTHRILSHIFSDSEQFVVHAPLDPAQGLRDEGAANHTRLTPAHGTSGVHVFVYGAEGSAADPAWARQTWSASNQVAVQHQLNKNTCLMLQQNPTAIEQGVFHNDVIAVGHLNCLLYHEEAYADGEACIARIRDAYETLHHQPLHCLKVLSQELSVADAVKTYLFNSQIVSNAKGGMVVIAPTEAEEHEGARNVFKRIVTGDNPVAEVRYVNLRQSMNNGGGPACLRLRIVMNDQQLASVQKTSRVIVDDALHAQLTVWAKTYFPDRLMPEDLSDPKLYAKTHTALTALAALTHLPILPDYAV